MYQYQRQQIKRRMEEKESQLQAVCREREELKSKLSQLQTLVQGFVGKKAAVTTAAALSLPPIESIGKDPSSAASSTSGASSSFVVVPEEEKGAAENQGEDKLNCRMS